MAILDAYIPFLIVFCFIVFSIPFFNYFRNQSGVVQILLIMAAVYIALLVFEKHPNHYIYRFLQVIFNG